MEIFLITLAFFIIASIYASAGFGGGSSYIAILLAANYGFGDVRFTALICNIVVVSSSCYYFYKEGLLDFRKMLPLVALSIPFAFLGGSIKPDENTYKIIASVALIIASTFMLIKKNTEEKRKVSNYSLSGVGGGIGLLSGFIGIGGGIFLSPVLHLINWKTAKVISAATSFFILVNSTAGLVGQSINSPEVNHYLCLILAIAVFVGGRIGNRFNIHILPAHRVRLISALLIGIVGIWILITQL